MDDLKSQGELGSDNSDRYICTGLAGPLSPIYEEFAQSVLPPENL